MRLKITSSSGNRFTDHYLGKTIIIPPWYVAKRGIPYAKTASIVRVLERAIVIRVNGKDYGVPRSIFTIKDEQNRLKVTGNII